MKPSAVPKIFFWVTNASPRNVTLTDLALNIRAFTTVNLMDNKHYKYTLEQLNKSRFSGSIYQKRDKIRVRDVAPIVPPKEKTPILLTAVIPSRERSLFSIKEVEYEELKVSDEEYAADIADLADVNETVIAVTQNSKKV